MRGYKNVINKGIELNEQGEICELMMETSGHGALKSNWFLDDGAYMSVKIIVEAARRRWQGRPDIRCLYLLLSSDRRHRSCPREQFDILTWCSRAIECVYWFLSRGAYMSVTCRSCQEAMTKEA
jgi:hypothetical protein